MQAALHLRDDVDRLYVKRKERERGLVITGDSVDESMQRLEDYREIRGGRLITAIRNNTDKTTTNRKEINRKQNWEKNNFFDVLSA